MPKKKRPTTREMMREMARAYRWWIQPARFDGTQKTYNFNLEMGVRCLVAAKELRDRAHAEA